MQTQNKKVPKSIEKTATELYMLKQQLRTIKLQHDEAEEKLKQWCDTNDYKGSLGDLEAYIKRTPPSIADKDALAALLPELPEEYKKVSANATLMYKNQEKDKTLKKLLNKFKIRIETEERTYFKAPI